jgi:hypothetical protein
MGARRLQPEKCHTVYSRELIWHELENDAFFHFLIPIFSFMYGNNRTPQW